MSKEFKIEWSQVPGWMRRGLSIARVQRPLVTEGELSSNEMENLAKFGYICVIVTLVAFAEVYCFLRYAIGMESLYAVPLSAVWGIIVFNVDRALFRDALDKARIRIALIIVATFVFSLGFSVLISDKPVTDIITEENRQLNEKIDQSLLANLQPYQDRLDEALKAQKEISQSIVVNDKTTEGIKSVTTIQNQAIQDAGDTTRAGKKRYKAANNAIYTINTTMKRQNEKEKSLKDVAAANVKASQKELEKQRERYQKAYEEQRVPPDYSSSHKSLTLLRYYLEVGLLHIFLAVFIAFIESFPLLIRFNYRDYDAVQLMIGLGNTPLKFFHERLKSIREEIEKAKQEMEEERKKRNQNPEGSSGEGENFKDAF